MVRRKKYHYKKAKHSFKSKHVVFIAIALLLFSPALLGLLTSNDTRDTMTNSDFSKELLQQEKESTAVDTDPRIANSVLQNIVLPVAGQSAMGTLELGPIKVSDNETQAPIASITKIITSLVILEKRPISLGEQGDTITLTAQDEQYYYDYLALEGTLTPVTAGLTMSQYEALQAMLLPSSNNMADTLVDQYFSSKEEYLTFANQYLDEKGLSDTQVADTTGFSPESRSTPSDLIKLGQLALENAVIKQIVAQPTAIISVAGEIPNYNPLIEDPDIIGIKPGATDEAGYTLLFAANLPKKSGEIETVIAVTLGQQDRAEYVQSARSMIAEARILLSK